MESRVAVPLIDAVYQSRPSQELNKLGDEFGSTKSEKLINSSLQFLNAIENIGDGKGVLIENLPENLKKLAQEQDFEGKGIGKKDGRLTRDEVNRFVDDQDFMIRKERDAQKGQ